MFQTLLVDPVPMVRVAAVTGVCKVMSIYWEMISATIIKSLISKVILELVWDASSADVRESVIKVRVKPALKGTSQQCLPKTFLTTRHLGQ